VQQIPRYILLLEDLKKMTAYGKHVDLPHTLNALQGMKDLAERINTKKGFSLAIELVRDSIMLAESRTWQCWRS
jgi:hypothetical protein